MTSEKMLIFNQDLYPDSLKSLDPDPHKTYADPKQLLTHYER